jgi:hypothetical protein
MLSSFSSRTLRGIAVIAMLFVAISSAFAEDSIAKPEEAGFSNHKHIFLGIDPEGGAPSTRDRSHISPARLGTLFGAPKGKSSADWWLPARQVDLNVGYPIHDGHRDRT